jgi:hypothetical protein
MIHVSWTRKARPQEDESVGRRRCWLWLGLSYWLSPVIVLDA